MGDQIDSFTFLLRAAAFIALIWPGVFVIYRVWIALPIKLHATREYPLQVNWEDTDASQLSSEQREFMRDALLGFRNAGFDVLANLRHKDDAKTGITKTGLWLIPMVNPLTGDLASISMITSKHLRFLSFQVISEFVDGFHITSANRRTSAFPDDPGIHSVRFDWISDPATLVECHRRRVAAAERSESRRRPLPERIIDRIEESRGRDLDWLVRSGNYFLDKPSNCVRLTWRGAFLMRWRHLPAVKRWIIRRRLAKARQLWMELGMDEWERPYAKEHVSESSSSTTRELATDPPLAAQSLPSLAYQSSLAPGQIRRERSNGTLILRLMLPTAGQILERKLPDFGVAGFLAVLLISGVSQFLSARKSTPALQWRHPSSAVRLDLVLMLVLLIYLVAQIARAFSRRARGTTLISASARALSFCNAPGQTRSGSFQRAQIETLIVRIDQVGLSGKVFKLQMNVTTDIRSVVLLVSRSAKNLYSIRLELMRAMGILD